jgi:hypothetical protein
MSGDESTIFSTYFLIAVIVFGTLGLLLIVFHEGIFDRGLGLFHSNASIQNATAVSIQHVAQRTGSCVINAVRWEKDGKEISTLTRGDDAELLIEGLGCDEMPLTVIVYSQNASNNRVVESFSQVRWINGTAVVLWGSEAEGSYYFSAELVSNGSIRAESNIIRVTALLSTRDPLLCVGFGDDRDYLYDVDFTFSSKSNGRQTFTASLNGTTLRVNTEEDRFFYDNSNGVLDITYDLVPSCGGIDIVYHITNPSSQPQSLPDFLFGGFRQDKVNPRYLELRRGGFLTAAQNANNFYADYYPSTFVYSPVTVIVSDGIAQGSSINYPFLEYNVEVIPQLLWSSDGKVAYRHSLVHPSSSGPILATIAAGSSQTYTISVRFSPSRNWLLTLDPYKKYFDQTYGSLKKESSKDMRPVGGVSEAFTEYVNDTNPRGYNYWYVPGKRLDIDGWGPEVTRLLGVLASKHYQRLMIWQTAGMYDPRICDCNFPSQYMDWLPKLVETQGELARIKDAGISLGFWWGRSGQVVMPVAWPPASVSSIIPANYSNSEHRSYLENQFNLGKQRGADMIGLDSFGFMEPYGRSKWLDEMMSSSLDFVHEHGGADIFHTRAANFYTDEYENGKWMTLSGPSVLSWYLNPNAEIWAYEVASPSESVLLGQSGMKARAEKLAKWGYTYVDNGLFLDVSNLDVSVSECLDHKDNDNDGVIDWPRDPDCTDEFDEKE